jgi:hypothetical protein
MVKAMWEDMDDDQIVAMPRSLFNFIATQIELPETAISIIATPPSMKDKL